MRRLLILMLCLSLHGLARGQTTYNYRYWFDGDVSTLQSGSQTGNSWHWDIPVGSFSDWFHLFHLQIQDAEGKWSITRTMPFVIVPSEIIGYSTDITGGHYRYWFDNDISTSQEKTATSNLLQLEIPMSSMDNWFHVIHFQVSDKNGNWSSVYTKSFAVVPEVLMKLDGTPDVTGGMYRYWFDADVRTMKGGSISSNLLPLEIPVEGVSDWFHIIHFQVSDKDGNWSATKTSPFVVLPKEDRRITRYSYWVNDIASNIQTQGIPSPQDKFSLVSLLPVETQPIRSKKFLFSVKDGQPIIYAKNDFHALFIDGSGRQVIEEREYVDEQVHADVEPVGELQPTQTFDRVAENEIRWYTIDAEVGDSLTFKTSQATAIQLFSPSGKELYSVSGPESVTYGGCHTWENGIHYLAVHDVTGTRPTMTLDYKRIDKYAILEQDVTRVGNGGCSTITFKGNGFRDLYSVSLYNTQGDTIKSIVIGHESNTTTTVTFDFSGATLGKYEMLFHFTTENRNFNYITVEEAVGIELAKTVTFPSAFPHGLSTTYTVKITNMGNMTAYSVPIYTWIMNKEKKDGIYHIEYSGLDLPGIFDGMDMDSLTISEKTKLQALSDELGDSHYFMLFRVEDEDSPGDSVWVRSNYFFTNIAPYETKTIQLTLSANEGVWAYFTVPEDWPSHNVSERESTSYMVKHRSKPQNTDNWYCCYRDRVECVANITMLVLDAASMVKPELGIADCALGWANQKLQAAGDTYCGTNDVEGDFAKSVNALTKAASAASVLAGCAGHSGISNVINALLHPSVAIECVTAFFQKIPDCPPCETCGDGGSSGGGSWDPNDIIGYLSNSSSFFIADFVNNVNYTIEFENDTTFAEAAAHSIVIKDTLDSRYFDLKSFIPTAIRVGSQNILLEDKDITTQNDVTSFIKTIDMRPCIYAIAQAEGTFNQKTGIAEWRFTTLDPMTMEPAEDVMQGILPVNYDGTSGIGEVMFEIGVKQGKADGAEITNRAGIVFDANDPILTPTWTNTVDAIAPTSTILGAIQAKTDTLTLRIAGEDNRSGVWRYDVYAQIGQGSSWEKVAENVPAILAEGETETLVDVRIFEGIEYGFMVLATDSAGNMERKAFEAEFELSTVKTGDANGDGVVDALDVILATSYYLGKDVHLNFAAADVVADGEINSLDVIAIQNIYLSSSQQALSPRKRKVKSDRTINIK